MSENLKEEIAKELGVYEQVKQDGGSWAGVSSRDCGNIVTKAIEIAKSLINLVLDKESIAKSTGLDLCEVEKLMN